MLIYSFTVLLYLLSGLLVLIPFLLFISSEVWPNGFASLYSTHFCYTHRELMLVFVLFIAVILTLQEPSHGNC